MEPSTPTTPTTPDEPSTPPTPAITYAGSYLVKTQLDLTGKNVLPGVAGAIINFIAGIDTTPFTSFLHLLRDSNIPDVSSALQAIPGWVLDAGGAVGDTLIVNDVYSQNPDVSNVLKQIANVGDIFKTLELQNQISIGALNTDGTYKISQQIVAIGFTWNGQKKDYNLSAAAMAQALIKGKSLTITDVKTFADFDGLFDGGSINLVIGEFLLAAINDLVLSPFGYSSLGDLFAQLFPCEALAEQVDIESVESICETGIAAATDLALAPIKNFALNNVVIGRANLNAYDRKTTEPQDYTTDHLKGTQTITLLNINGTAVTFSSAPFDGYRLATPIVIPQY